jgi:hypothetical protein
MSATKTAIIINADHILLNAIIENLNTCKTQTWKIFKYAHSSNQKFLKRINH